MVLDTETPVGAERQLVVDFESCELYQLIKPHNTAFTSPLPTIDERVKEILIRNMIEEHNEIHEQLNDLFLKENNGRPPICHHTVSIV